MTFNVLIWTCLSGLAIVLIFVQGIVLVKLHSKIRTNHKSETAYKSSNDNLRCSNKYFNNENTRLRFLLNLGYEEAKPSEKVIILSRRRKSALLSPPKSL